MNRIPLETRIMRIRSGICSSPDHILPGLQIFAEMPVIRMLSVLFPDLKKGFINLMSIHFQKDAKQITYGDLAVLICDEHMRNGIRNDRYIDSLILYYCTCFEFEICYQNTVQNNGSTLTRDQYLERLGLQDIRGINDLRIDEYLAEIEKLDLPESSVRWLYAFSIEKTGLLTTDLKTIYGLLREHALKNDIKLHDPIMAGYPANSALIRKQLIELLIMPLACLITQKDQKQYGKETENEYE